MTLYYFDIETYSKGSKPDPENDKIITIQYHEIDSKTLMPVGKVVILKEWESSEEGIVTDFYNSFFSEGKSVWNFIPIGFNLNFEWEFLISKFNRYLGTNLSSRELHYARPHIDLKHIIVMLNGCNFKGAKLSEFSIKSQDGSSIKNWYETKKYDKIEYYIAEETAGFLWLLIRLSNNLKGITKEKLIQG